MRVGVVCEGPSDYPAISIFLADALQRRSITAEVRPVFPELDRTRPEGGWGNVLLWLKRNPPETRIAKYFNGGLFAGELATTPLDALVFHLDADIVDDELFRGYVKKTYEHEVALHNQPAERAGSIKQVLRLAADLENLTQTDVQKHVLAVAVEATESWCVAAFHAQPGEYEVLRGQALIDAFMTVLERSEGRQPQGNYANIDKNADRRRRFCRKHAAGSERLIQTCDQFKEAVDALEVLAANRGLR